MLPSQLFLGFSILLLISMAQHVLYAGDPAQTELLCRRMEEAWARVTDYQTDVEIKTFRGGESYEKRKFRYTFKKPKWTRIDFESPYPGMILFYPDREGKAVLRRFFDYHLDPDSFLLRDPSGQRVDQTDLGLLIGNIRRSLTDLRKGAVESTEDDDRVHLRVLSEDHFRRGILTRYEFVLLKRMWLPVQVEESTPEGELKRTVEFRNLRTNLGFPDSFFQVAGE